MRALALALLVSLQVCCTAGLPAPKVAEAEQEATFWQLCWSSDGDPYICPGGQPMTWKLPIRLADANFSDRVPAKAAAEAWNQWLGVTVFTAARTPEEIDVLIVASPEPGAVFAGVTQANMKEGRLKAVVTMFQPYHNRQDVIAHELGHVLGLAHDVGTPWSLMDGEPSWILPVLTAADCRALAGKYEIKNPPCLKPYEGAP